MVTVNNLCILGVYTCSLNQSYQLSSSPWNHSILFEFLVSYTNLDITDRFIFFLSYTWPISSRCEIYTWLYPHLPGVWYSVRQGWGTEFAVQQYRCPPLHCSSSGIYCKHRWTSAINIYFTQFLICILEMNN